MASTAVVTIDMHDKLPKLASGKVRDLFKVDDRTLLFVASDRVSAFDVVMDNGIPGKGALLTKMSMYWFRYLQENIPGLQTHFLTSSLPIALNPLGPDLHRSIESRSMQVRNLKTFDIESIVRGYITGSAWAEYKKTQTVWNIPQPAGLVEGQKLPTPIWTPSTKAPAGQHDENISQERACTIVGEKFGKMIEELSIQIYEVAAKRTEEVGIILADTKFEFGLDGEEVVLIDEVLTPDSSRFWVKDTWKQNLGRQQPSFDKQFLRDWLVENGLKGKEGIEMPEHVVMKTAAKYQEAYKLIVGKEC